MTAKSSRVVMQIKLTQLVRAVSVVLLIIILVTLNFQKVYAAELTSRSIRVESSLINEINQHSFTFNTNTSASIGSLVLEYCTNLPFYNSPCTAPTGLIANTASIAAQSGITGLSVSVPNTTINRLVLTRANSVIGATVVNLVLSNITNQSNENDSVYVRISTLTSNDGSGVPIDFGAVVYTTTIGVGVDGYVPPYLTFCVGVTVSLDCSDAEGSLMTLGELSSTSTKTTTNQFSAATNDPTGYNVFMSGGTMTSGNEIIPALSANTGSITGTSQFGVNLRLNNSPSAGANVSGAGTAVVTANYGTANSFRYVNGELIAQSTLPTEFNRFTVTFLVNVSNSQRPGVYASSFTYTAVASF